MAGNMDPVSIYLIQIGAPRNWGILLHNTIFTCNINFIFFYLWNFYYSETKSFSVSYQCSWWCQNYGEQKGKLFSSLLVFSHWNIWTFGWHRALVKREHWDDARWQTSAQQQLDCIRLHLVVTPHHVGSKMFLDFFQDTQTADNFFLETFQNQCTLKASESWAQSFKRGTPNSICKIFVDGCICPWLLCSSLHLQSNKKQRVCLAYGK